MRHPLTLSLVALAFAAGCGGHSPSDKSSSSTSGGSTAGVNSGTTGGSTGGSTGTEVAVTQTALTADQAEQMFAPGPLVGLNVTLEAVNAQVRVTRLDVVASGTIDETLLGAAALVEDLNGNGVVDAGETAVADAPAVLADDGTYALAPLSPMVLVPGTPRSFLLTIASDAVAPLAQAQAVGKTLEVTLDAAGVVAEDDQGALVPATGQVPASSSVVLEIGDTALISEVVIAGGSGTTSEEYVEIFNATGRPIDLTNTYLTDFTDNPTYGRFYWKLPTGQDFGPSANQTSADFIVRFPAGASLAPGQVATIAVDGGAFKVKHGIDADYQLRNGNGAATTAVQMLSWDGIAPGTNFVAAPVSLSAGLGNAGEPVVLFVWDGVSDLIQDVDIVCYGSLSSTNTSINKSPGQGVPDVKVDSLTDADLFESTFQNDSTDLFQMDHTAPGTGSVPAIHRIDYTEGAEVKTGGNGITGNDETSEPFGDLGNPGTFTNDTSPTPGQIP